MKRLIIRSNLLLCLLLSFITVNAQRPISYDSPLREYNTAMELYQKHEFGAAQEYFQYVYEHTTDQQYDMKSTSYFYQGVCAVKLNHGDAAFLLRDFVRKYPIHTYVPEAHFYIARSYYYQKDYKKALENFNELDERKIEQEDLAEYYFKKGFCHLYAAEKGKPSDRDEAMTDAKYNLRKARTYEGQYQQKAVYYLAHLEYKDGQYEAALADFEEIKDAKEYAKIVPSYILQIKFLEGDYEAVVNSAPALVSQSSDKAELYRIIGISYFNLGQYSNAAEYFNKLESMSQSNKNGSNPIARPDHYAMGYTYYKVKDYTDAISHLSQVTDTTDAMTQNAYYVIADCFLKQGKLSDAANYFYEAQKLDYSADIQEDAFYNYAKLQYETSTALSQQKAISTIEEYIKRYPYTTRSQEMSSYLASIYASTKNYTAAIKAIEQLDKNHKSPEILRSYQRCTHFRAMELIADKKYKDAVKMIDKSMTSPLDGELHRSNLYWKAEALYRAESYKESYNAFLLYQKADRVSSDENYPLSLYSFGYAALKTQKYKEAQKSFDKFLTFCNTEKYESYQPDVYARIGDCYFMQKDLKSAITNYTRCEQLKGNNADYALYQQSVCYGYQQNTEKKVELLEKFTKYYSKSPYIDDVEFELAGIYHAQGQYTLAINSYNNFIRKYPKSTYVPKAYNRLAQAYQNAGQTEKSIETFKYVVDKYQGSQEAKDAISNLQDIYTEMGRPGDFLDYVTSKGNITISAERQDSITYKSAESKYNKGDCDMAISGFNDYIKKFPNGFFIAEAYAKRADCEYGNRSYEDALRDYIYLISNFRTSSNEIALKRAATILFNQKDYAGALTYFNDLLAASTSEANTSYAYNGIMRCAFEQNNYKDALEGAKGYIASPKADPDLMDDAHLIAGKSSFELRDYNAAKKYLKPLAQSSTNTISAEAAYYCALSEFKKGDYSACEKEITTIIEARYTSAYWIANTFILYGDYYKAIGNTFQARHTYQSIVDNYDGEDLREVARQRIAALEPTAPASSPTPSNSFDDDDLNPED